MESSANRIMTWLNFSWRVPATCGGARVSIKCHQVPQNDKLDLSLCRGESPSLSFSTYPGREGCHCQPTSSLVSRNTPSTQSLIVLIAFSRVNAISHSWVNPDDCFEQVNGCLGTIESGRALLWRTPAYQQSLLSPSSPAKC